MKLLPPTQEVLDVNEESLFVSAWRDYRYLALLTREDWFNGRRHFRAVETKADYKFSPMHPDCAAGQFIRDGVPVRSFEQVWAEHDVARAKEKIGPLGLGDVPIPPRRLLRHVLREAM